MIVRGVSLVVLAGFIGLARGRKITAKGQSVSNIHSTKSLGNRLKALAPPILRRFSRRAKAVIRNWPNRHLTAQEVFSQIYAAKLWGSGKEDFYSGPGSIAEAAQPYADFVISLIAKHKIRSVVDLGCGDFRVGRMIASCGVNYTGVDVVQPLIDQNAERYGSDHVSFKCLDIASDDLPDGELCLIREVFQHLSNAQIGAILARVGKYGLVLVTDVQPDEVAGYKVNKDKVHGASSRLLHGSILRLDAPPFNIPNVQLVLEADLPDFAIDTIDGASFKLRTFLVSRDVAAAADQDRSHSRKQLPGLPAAVVVGANLNGLGLARSLRRGGVPVFVLDTSQWLPAMWARGCHSVVVQTLDRTLIGDLLRLRQRFDQNPLLFLANEPAVFAVSEARDQLAGYRFRLPPHRMVVALSDKIELQQMSEECGYPVPRAVCLETAADLPRLGSLAFPAVVKPADKRCVYTGQTERIHRLDGLAQAQAICGELLAGSVRAIVQEWIPGDDSQIVFCLFYCARQGVATAMFTGRKIVSHPTGIGSTGICIAAPEAKAAVEPLAWRFIELMAFVGMGSLEFKWHPERREFLMVEPTVGRTDWQEEIAALCGENVPLAAYRQEVGLPNAEARRRSAAWRENFRRRWPTEIPRQGARIYDGYWRITDPAPAIVHYLDSVLQHLRPFAHWASPWAPMHTARS